MIVLPNIDQHIWDIEFLIVDILNELQQQGSVTINLNKEGPDASELGLYALLDHVCQTYNVDKKLITIETCNVLEQHPEYRIVKDDPMYVKEVKLFAKAVDCTRKNFDQIKHFGLFVGRSNWQRLWLSAEMFGKYKEQTLQTFLYDAANDFHKSNLGFDRLMNELQGQCDFESISNLLAAAPLRIEAVNQFPIISPAHFNIGRQYNKFLVEIVCETYTAGNSFYPTEKIWRPLVCKTPFVVQGPVNFLKNLKRMGFKTFSNWWDESYDEDGQILGTQTILNNIKRISAMSTQELQLMYNDMKPTLDHNYNVLLELDEPFEIFK